MLLVAYLPFVHLSLITSPTDTFIEAELSVVKGLQFVQAPPFKLYCIVLMELAPTDVQQSVPADVTVIVR